MNYDSPELRELLAGEYALGTLIGAARRRFERLLVEDAHLRAEVVTWETRFATWAARLPREAPRARVWRRIARRIENPRRRPRWGGIGFWRACTGAVAAALLAVVVWWQGFPPPAAPVPTEVAVLSSQAGKPLWVVSLRARDRTLAIKTTGPAAPPAGKAYELWMLPRGGAQPVSLGVLPGSGTRMRKLSAKQVKAMADAKALAVSVEPPGGSPTGAPTGPVVYTAPLLET